MRRTLPILLLVAACGSAPAPEKAGPARETAPLAALAGETPVPAARMVFPAPDRPVAQPGTGAWSDEESRDNSGDRQRVFALLGLRPGLAVADIGAGSGYYTVRIAPVLEPGGTLIANDIIPDYVARLKARVATAKLRNVQFVLGDPGNANLPPASTDVALMAHMYHEIADPFGLLWHLHRSLRPGDARPDPLQSGELRTGAPWRGIVAIIDTDRSTARHGTPPDLLACELQAAGYRRIAFHRLENASYLAVFEPVAAPAPAAIEPCKAGPATRKGR